MNIYDLAHMRQEYANLLYRMSLTMPQSKFDALKVKAEKLAAEIRQAEYEQLRE